MPIYYHQNEKFLGFTDKGELTLQLKYVKENEENFFPITAKYVGDHNPALVIYPTNEPQREEFIRFTLSNT